MPLSSKLRRTALLTFAVGLACAEPHAGVDLEQGGDALDEVYGSCTAESSCSATTVPTNNECVFYVGFDGSGLYSEDEDSNVGLLYKLTEGMPAYGADGKRAGSVDADTTRAYIEGVAGLPFGQSAERVDRGLNAICQHLDKRTKSCDIVLMGYSRGAIIANQVAHALEVDGCGDDGRHRGTEIAFFGAFDPINRVMGYEWRGRDGQAVPWWGHVPDNVVRFVQVYKQPLEDPRGGYEGLALTTTPLYSDSESECTRGLERAQHPYDRQWNHGEIGHWSLPREIMLCALESDGIILNHGEADD